MKRNNYLWILAATMFVSAGCQHFERADSPASITPPKKLMETFVANAPAGIPVNAVIDPVKFKNEIMGKKFATRTDPFSLKTSERSFEISQTAERFLSENGFVIGFDPKPEVIVPPPAVEEQPYRRLSGVIVGESVLGIIEMGGSQGTQIIRPGQMIPNSEWRVISIDEEKAVLRRSGNKLPREITVRLESRPVGQ